MAEFLITAPDGKKYKITGATREGALAALKNKLNPQPNQQPVNGDTSFGTALKVGQAQSESLGQSGAASLQRNLSQGIFGDAQRYLTENIANPVRELVGKDPIDIDAVNQAETKRLEKAAELSAEAAQKLQDDLNFKNLTTGDIRDIPSFVNFVSQKTAQALPYMGAALASGGTLTYPFGVGEISQSLDEIEGLDQAQKDDIAAAGGAIMTVLENLGIAKLLPNGISTSVIGGISKGFITEGTTEGLQELVVIGSEALAGKQFSQEEIVNRLKESVAAGGVVGSSIKATSNTATKVKSLFTSEGNLVDPDSIDADQKQAAASVAKIIRQVANQNGYNLSDVNASSSKGAKQALEATHENISEQIKQIAGNKVVKDLLSPKKASTLDQLIDDYTAAQVALRQGKNKVKSKVTEENYAAIMRLLPDSAEKTQIANLLKMSNQVTDLFNNGLKGGISQYTDYFNPLATSGGVYDPTRIANIILGAGGAFQSGGSTLGIAAGGRLVDAVTGRRSAVNRFTQQNENRPGLDAPSGTSLIQSQADAEAAARLQAEQEAADAETARFNRRQMNLELTQRDAAPTPDSPQAIMEDATGLDRSGVARVLRVIEATADNPAILDAIASYRKSVAEGGKVKDLSPLIRLVNERVNNNPGLVERVREPNNSVQPNVDPTSPQQPQGGDEFGPQFTTPQNYNRGIENNLQFNRELQDGAALDQSLSRVDRGRIITSLENLTNNLGSSPVPTVQTEIQKLQDAGVSQEAIDTYVQPYVDRVIGQQKRNTPKQPKAPIRMQMALPLFENPLPIEGKVTVKKIGEAMNQDHMEKVGRKLYPEQSDEDYNIVLDYGRKELTEQLKQPNSGVGWYSKDVDNAMTLASRVYPTLATNQEHRQLYLTFAGIFSNGTDPDNAFIMSSMAFDDFLRTGEIPTNRAEGFRQQGLEPPTTTFKSAKTGKMVTKDAGWGIRDAANQQQLGMLKYLVQREGSLKSAMEFLLTPQRRTDINDVMLDSGLYKAGRFTTKAEREGPDEYGFLAFGKKLGRYSLGLHGVEVDAGDTTIDLWYTRTYRRYTGRLLDTPIGKEGVAAQPANDQERDTIFRLTGDLVAENPDLTVGDVQALLWFFEKRTWGAQGLNTKEGTNSSGAKKLLRQRGIDPDQIDDGERSDGSSTQDSAAPQQPRPSLDPGQPRGVAAILAERIQGTDSRPTTRGAVPTANEVKEAGKVIKAAIEIGKPGTRFENGIQNLDQVKELANVINVTLEVFDSQKALSDSFEGDGGTAATNILGFYTPGTGVARSLAQGTQTKSRGEMNEFDAYITALHEVLHGLADQQMNPALLTKLPQAEGMYRPFRKIGKNTLTGRIEVASDNSFDNFIARLLTNTSKTPKRLRNQVLKEIKDMQSKGRYSNNEKVRDGLGIRFNPAYKKYVRGAAEMAVDPLVFYMNNPKQMKKDYPATTQAIKGFFQNSTRVQFFTHPLAMAMAVIMAVMAKQDEAADEEERRRMMPPPGALNQPMQPGALSA